jgi:DNA-binding protein HU-beta
LQTLACTAYSFIFVIDQKQFFNLKSKSMNKAQLIDAIAADAGISKAQAKAALDSVTGNIGSALASGDKVSLVGFGTFSVSTRGAREGRNPQTGATIKIAAKKVAKFKAGAELGAKL